MNSNALDELPAIPDTIDGCVAMLRNPPHSKDLRRNADFLRQLSAKAARLFSPQIGEIVKIVKSLPREMLYVPDTTGIEILEYADFCEDYDRFGIPQDLPFVRSSLFCETGNGEETVVMYYINGEYDGDDGSPEYSCLGFPLSWIVCRDRDELERLICLKVYGDVVDYIERQRSSIDRYTNVCKDFKDLFSVHFKDVVGGSVE